jgi:hypothetical protein
MVWRSPLPCEALTCSPEIVRTLRLVCSPAKETDMKRSRFTEEQIIGILKEHQAGLSASELVPEARDQRCDLLQLALEVWRHGGQRGQAAEAARGREREAEEAVGGVDDGCSDAARDARKKLLRPSSRRSAVTWAMTEKGYSQRRACRLVGIDPRVHRYQSSRPDDAGLRSRLRELSVRTAPVRLSPPAHPA